MALWHGLLLALAASLTGLIGKMFAAEAQARLEDAPDLLIRLAARVLPADDRADFLSHAASDLEVINADARHPVTRMVKTLSYGFWILLRSPLIRLELTRGRVKAPVKEMLAAPPQHGLRIRRTTFCLHRGRSVTKESMLNHRLTWLYRVQRIGNIDGPITVRSIGVGYWWHFTALTMPWPGRMGRLIQDSMPIMGVERMR
jgi:hypothetical protein